MATDLRPHLRARSGSAAAQSGTRHPLADQPELISAVDRCRGGVVNVASEPVTYVSLPRYEGNGFSPLVGQEPVHPARFGGPVIEPGSPFQAPEATAARTSASRQPRAAGRSQDGHARRAAVGVARPVPLPGAGRMGELRAEVRAAAEAGHPRDAGVVELGLADGGGRGAGPVVDLLQLGRELGQQRRPDRRAARLLDGRQGVAQRRSERPPAAALVPRAGRADLAAQAGHRRRVDRGEPEGDRPAEVAQLAPGQRRGEHDEDMAAAGRGDVGEDLATAPGHQPGQLPRLGGHRGGRIRAMFTMLPDSRTISCAASTGHVKVKDQHPPGARGWMEDRDRARLARRFRGKRPRVTGRVGAAAVTRDPDVRRTGQRGHDRPPRRHRGRSAGDRLGSVWAAIFNSRRVSRGQW